MPKTNPTIGGELRGKAPKGNGIIRYTATLLGYYTGFLKIYRLHYNLKEILYKALISLSYVTFN